MPQSVSSDRAGNPQKRSGPAPSRRPVIGPNRLGLCRDRVWEDWSMLRLLMTSPLVSGVSSGAPVPPVPCAAGLRSGRYGLSFAAGLLARRSAGPAGSGAELRPIPAGGRIHPASPHTSSMLFRSTAFGKELQKPWDTLSFRVVVAPHFDVRAYRGRTALPRPAECPGIPRRFPQETTSTCRFLSDSRPAAGERTSAQNDHTVPVRPFGMHGRRTPRGADGANPYRGGGCQGP